MRERLGRTAAGASRLAVSLLLCLGLAGPALAQSAAPPASESAPGQFDFFVLALSWSPGFCAATENAKASSQCAAGAELGFVVHGLWPQLEHGFPNDCGGDRNPSRAALDQTIGLYPDIGLARYEWHKHGACTGAAPAAYFADVRRARDAIAIPPNFQSPQAAATMTPAAVARAFFEANPRLKPGMMAVACKRDILEEVRICLTKDLRDFRACPEVARAACRASEISVPAPR